MAEPDPTPDAQAFVLKYRIERREIWRWYWWAWRQPRGLWRYWIVVGAIVATGSYLLRTAAHPSTSNDVVVSLVIALATSPFSSCTRRSCTRDANVFFELARPGWTHRLAQCLLIGTGRTLRQLSNRGTYIAAIVAGGIPLGIFWLRTLNGNAFIIPNRAFEGKSERLAFLQHARNWHAASALRFPDFRVAVTTAELGSLATG